MDQGVNRKQGRKKSISRRGERYLKGLAAVMGWVGLRWIAGESETVGWILTALGLVYLLCYMMKKKKIATPYDVKAGQLTPEMERDLARACSVNDMFRIGDRWLFPEGGKWAIPLEDIRDVVRKDRVRRGWHYQDLYVQTSGQMEFLVSREEVISFGRDQELLKATALIRVKARRRDPALPPETDYTGPDLPGIGQEEKAKFIMTFAAKYALAQKPAMDMMGRGMDIGYMNDLLFSLYSAPEPCRSLCLIHWESICEETLSAGTKLPEAFRAAGHAINRCFAMKTDHFLYNQMPLYTIIAQDVFRHVEQYLSFLDGSLPDKKKWKLLTALNLTADSDFRRDPEGLGDEKLEALRRSIIRRYDDLFWRREYEAVSIAFSGITNNVLKGPAVMDESYCWYAKAGRTMDPAHPQGPSVNNDYTGQQAQELWKRFFAARMLHDWAALDAMWEVLPTACQAMNSLAVSMILK